MCFQIVHIALITAVLVVGGVFGSYWMSTKWPVPLREALHVGNSELDTIFLVFAASFVVSLAATVWFISIVARCYFYFVSLLRRPEAAQLSAQ